ncbi:hypothetical protein W02_31850 [Nitrospira sp. KM1]|uniref:PilZ domain-containing protein n=1 Tax=Nitrospira sp. KM1 TaxID=1936990 RepID=UPI0013A7538E|nr:PilZ domain-containing protein [Nitrospira sp. KM1]BCA56045.1 hypothetical protein W02_31850 [Nitrospira sp. KM1]
MKDALGMMLRDAWREKGNPDCPHLSLSRETGFAGTFTEAYLCTVCGTALHLASTHPPEQRSAERRMAPRFRVQFRTVLGGRASQEGQGTVLDLSIGGCRVETPVAMVRDASIELRIHVPDLDWPLMIDEATVQWVKNKEYGLGFVKLKETEWERLRRVIAKLADEG